MPEVSRFYGIVIRFFWADHPPPHFHAAYSGEEARFDIRTLSVIGGRLPPRAMGLVTEWATRHQNELLGCWERASRMEDPGKIAPLD